jgi:hypothetical protein
MSTPRPRFAGRPVIAAIGLATVAVTVAGCGGGSKNNAAALGSGGTSNSRFPSISGTSGKITKVGSEAAMVQTSNGTKTVAFSASITRFTKTSAATRSTIAAGDCVSVGAVGSPATSTPAASPAPATRSTPTTAVARTVTITSTSGCPQSRFTGGQNGPPNANGFGGSGGGEFGAPGGTAPGVRPTPTGSASPGRFGQGFGRGGTGGFGGRGFGGMVSGTVKSVTGSKFVVASLFGGKKTTVTTTAATTYTTIASAKFADVVVGQCLTAFGSATSDGTIDARAAALSAPVNGSCPAASGGAGIGGFGGFGGPPGGFTGAAGGTGA